MSGTANILPAGHVAVVIGGGGAIGAACVGAFAGAVGTLAGQPAERERLSLAARRLYTSEFDWPRLAATLLDHLC